MRIVFVHGWGMNSAVWEPLLEHLPPHVESVCIDLPGHGQSIGRRLGSAEEVAALLLDCVPGQVFWVGWSMGALPLLYIARHHPDRVAGLVLTASTPCFVVRDGWRCAIGHNALEEFAEDLSRDYATTLKRFLALQVRGSAEGLGVLRSLRRSVLAKGAPDTDALNVGLEWLKETDLRAELTDLQCRNLWVLGDNDILVPAAVAEYLRQVVPGAQVDVFSGAGHAPFLSHGRRFASRLLEFLHDE